MSWVTPKHSANKKKSTSKQVGEAETQSHSWCGYPQLAENSKPRASPWTPHWEPQLLSPVPERWALKTYLKDNEAHWPWIPWGYSKLRNGSYRAHMSGLDLPQELVQRQLIDRHSDFMWKRLISLNHWSEGQASNFLYYY